MKLNWKLYNRQKVINLCYFGAVTAAFILSLAHNNRVEASVDTRDYFSYLMIDDNADTSETAMESPDNIKALFKMVDELVKNKNIALYRETIYERVWGDLYDDDTRTVDLHINRIRKKLGFEKQIQTVFKVGYRFVE